MAKRIACVGGGPGGLFFSILMKRAMPDAEVVLFERNQASDAFGFGVVFSDATLRAIDEADPVVRNGLEEFGTHWDTIDVWLKGERASFSGNGMAAIHRKTLLRLLQGRAAAEGVEMRFGEFVPSIGYLDDFDIVVGSDGANSPTRDQVEVDLGHHVETAAAKFIWFGTTFMFDGLTFIHKHNEHGNFAVHAYPISDDVSTFIVETDEETWRRAGLDSFDVTSPPGLSDEKSQAYLEKLFENEIPGGKLIANNSRWANFRTRKTDVWHADNVVFIGDAVHTAHFSVGSGTKMAMEDAIVLAREIAADPNDLEAAFTKYQAAREPAVARIQNAAGPSLRWWEHFAIYYRKFEPWQFAFHFFSRSISLSKIRQRDPEFASRTERGWRSQHRSSPLHTPLELAGRTFPGRKLVASSNDQKLPVLTDPSSGTVVPLTTDSVEGGGHLLTAPGTYGEVAKALETVPPGAAFVAITGGDPLVRMAVSELVRLELGIPSIVVEDDPSDDDVETIVLAGRADGVAASGWGG